MKTLHAESTQLVEQRSLAKDIKGLLKEWQETINECENPKIAIPPVDKTQSIFTKKKVPISTTDNQDPSSDDATEWSQIPQRETNNSFLEDGPTVSNHKPQQQKRTPRIELAEKIESCKRFGETIFTKLGKLGNRIERPYAIENHAEKLMQMAPKVYNGIKNTTEDDFDAMLSQAKNAVDVLNYLCSLNSELNTHDQSHYFEEELVLGKTVFTSIIKVITNGGWLTIDPNMQIGKEVSPQIIKDKMVQIETSLPTKDPEKIGKIAKITTIGYKDYTQNGPQWSITKYEMDYG